MGAKLHTGGSCAQLRQSCMQLAVRSFPVSSANVFLTNARRYLPCNCEVTLVCGLGEGTYYAVVLEELESLPVQGIVSQIQYKVSHVNYIWDTIPYSCSGLSSSEGLPGLAERYWEEQAHSKFRGTVPQEHLRCVTEVVTCPALVAHLLCQPTAKPD